MRLPRNDARCKPETRDLPTHCPAKRPKKRLSDGSRTDRRKREHAQLCELARTSPEESNSCHCNSAIETCAGARIEISKQRRAGSSDVVDEAMRELGDERWSRNDISVPGLSGLSVGVGGAVWRPAHAMKIFGRSP